MKNFKIGRTSILSLFAVTAILALFITFLDFHQSNAAKKEQTQAHPAYYSTKDTVNKSKKDWAFIYPAYM